MTALARATASSKRGYLPSANGAVGLEERIENPAGMVVLGLRWLVLFSVRAAMRTAVYIKRTIRLRIINGHYQVKERVPSGR